jgi:hypothetical protein
MKAAIKKHGPINVFDIVEQGVQMGMSVMPGMLLQQRYCLSG